TWRILLLAAQTLILCGFILVALCNESRRKGSPPHPLSKKFFHLRLYMSRNLTKQYSHKKQGQGSCAPLQGYWGQRPQGLIFFLLSFFFYLFSFIFFLLSFFFYLFSFIFFLFFQLSRNNCEVCRCAWAVV
ncbi:MAG: hypothetical protein FWC89_14105, partial [Defluviitaleaceae bacterium]|nr:hypothetical protein [Defluviitaleaceae bacterium]